MSEEKKLNRQKLKSIVKFSFYTLCLSFVLAIHVPLKGCYKAVNNPAAKHIIVREIQKNMQETRNFFEESE